MTSTALGIEQITDSLKETLISYIEATYHLSNKALVEDRRNLLEKPKTIAQIPYVESTPRYQIGKSYFDLGLDDAINEIFELLKDPSGDLKQQLYDPPWHHQSEAVENTLIHDKSLIVTTGTGSGKTETFLFPILGKLAKEARDRSNVFRANHAVRALVLYPMNALVNDQLGRMRLLFGDPRVVSKFKEWSGRPIRFARYTSRTPYPGVRNNVKDRQRLAPLNEYYVRKEKIANDPNHESHLQTKQLVQVLKERGKWPAKPSLSEWWGRDNARWGPAGNRCRTLPDDSELLTRHEVLDQPPDVLITNYSMLEYMLMRPIERPIFDATSEWLAQNPGERLLLVLDEAHLYRGAAGTEVSHLIRRLTARLGITSDRLQVICTSASFNDDGKGGPAIFASQLTGKEVGEFSTITGLFRNYPLAKIGSNEDTEMLSNIHLDSLYSDDDQISRDGLNEFLSSRGITPTAYLHQDLLGALEDYGPMQMLISSTMDRSTPLNELAAEIFPDSNENTAMGALSALMAMGSLAKKELDSPGLLPCRVHSLFRGLAGLWVCINPKCSGVQGTDRPAGRLYDQPISTCDDCGARVFELFTCRHCGRAYARAYTNDLQDPQYLWSEPGETVTLASGTVESLDPLDILLEEPTAVDSGAEMRELNVITGRLIATAGSPINTRTVWIPSERLTVPNNSRSESGQFEPCGACGKSTSTKNRQTVSSVQDHQTKGDEPFQSLVAKQISVQPPNPVTEDKSFAPLEGRKVLAFSDSRQTAARLAPNLTMYSMKDALRPLVIKGYQVLQSHNQIRRRAGHLGRLYVAAQIGAIELGTRLRIDLSRDEAYDEEPFRALSELLKIDVIDQDDLDDSWEKVESQVCPGALVPLLLDTVSDPHYGLEAFGLASIEEQKTRVPEFLETLPIIPGIAESATQKLDLIRAWLRQFAKMNGFTLNGIDAAQWPFEIRSHSTGVFRDMKYYFQVPAQATKFENSWLPILLNKFTEKVNAEYRLKGNEISLTVGESWKICQYCRTPQRSRELQTSCMDCKRPDLVDLAPASDEVFRARTAYYRRSSEDILDGKPLSSPMIVSKEHTAQLNQTQFQEAVSLAERYELLFQDVKIDGGDRREYAVDLLSCTTTMEVGIDIGSLSGVALRNMPPSRSNYQQRAGRAGRRADSIATVLSIAGSDSHDIYNFLHPDELIRGSVVDPTLCLDNRDIAERHVIAFLLQRYLLHELDGTTPGTQPGNNVNNLFSVLGTVEEFNQPGSRLSFSKFKDWLSANLAELKTSLYTWLPMELADKRIELVEGISEWPVRAIEQAIAIEANISSGVTDDDDLDDDDSIPDPGVELPAADAAAKGLLNRLLKKGILPRYAFPTDVAAFHIFDVPQTRNNRRPIFKYTPSQGTAIALTQYAPGRRIWVDGREWESGALYSAVPGELEREWSQRLLYLECSLCGLAKTTSDDSTEIGSLEECPACGGDGTLGPAQYWLHPAGFLHPVDSPERKSADDSPSPTLATRAKLTTEANIADDDWTELNDQIRIRYCRDNLLVTNRGEAKGGRYEGFDYCVDCGRIELSGLRNGRLANSHNKPFVVYGPGNMLNCQGHGGVERHVTLGTRFPTDVLLMRFDINDPMRLMPGRLGTTIALRTASEALSKAGSLVLDQAKGEIQADFRPAITELGQDGRQVEIYLYDTLDGGAGFTRELESKGLEVFNRALEILEECPGNCDGSCYECLRSFANRFEHGSLDRFIGASFLRYALYGETNETEQALNRREKIIDILAEDLLRQGRDDYSVERNVLYPNANPKLPILTAPILIRDHLGGGVYVVSLHNPLTPDHSSDAAIMQHQDENVEDIKLFDELNVMRNLPQVTLALLDALEGS